MMKEILQILSIVLLIAAMVVIGICKSPVQVRPEYTTQISVETPDKIKNAISNVVSDLEKRDFVPVNLEVKWHPADKTYVVFAMGIDRTNLCKYEP